MLEEIIYIQLNNWGEGEDYPDAEPFLSWFDNDLKLKFLDENWIKENNLCVETNMIDMSITFRITAPKIFVTNNCPELLTKYTQFIVKKNKHGDICDKFGYDFLEYNKENIGLHYAEE